MRGIDGYNALGLLHVTLVERRNALEEEICRGNLGSYEDYRAKCGEIQGIIFAERELVDLQEKVELA